MRESRSKREKKLNKDNNKLKYKIQLLEEDIKKTSRNFNI